MKIHDCETCAFRKNAETHPETLFARVWRWHAGWCPGEKAYRRRRGEAAKTTVETDTHGPQPPDPA